MLLVDDEPAIRRTGSRLFSRFGYRVLTAEDGQAAIACLEEHAPGIDVVVTDMVMPNMDARELITVIRGRWPTLPVLLSTAFDAGRLGGSENLFTGFVPKPYTPEEMLQAVRTAIDGRG